MSDMKIKSGRTGRSRHRWVRNRRVQAARATMYLNRAERRLERCDTCHKPTQGACVQHFRYSGKANDADLVKVECKSCDLRARVAEYRKSKQLDNTLMAASAFFVSDEKILKEPWMQGDDRREQRVSIRDRLAAQIEYASDFWEISAADEEIYGAIAKMAAVVWSGWLQRYYRDSPERGHSAVVGGIEILVWGCAGRVVMTINGKDAEDLSVIFDETSEEPRAGRQGIHATKEQAVGLLEFLTTRSAEFKAAIQPKSSVGLL